MKHYGKLAEKFLLLLFTFTAGDWALVGNTAALLATDHSVTSNQQGSIITNATELSKCSLASQFSRLVDSNDWEAVIRVANMLECASDSESTKLEHLSPSELQNKADLQALIIDLVQEVVPDEVGETVTNHYLLLLL
jgi:hypothetical protein